MPVGEQAPPPANGATNGATAPLVRPPAPALRRPRVLLAASGSVATIKLPQLAACLLNWADVRVVTTESARHFIAEDHLPHACAPLLGEGRFVLLGGGDADEWTRWKAMGDPVLHIELRRWADALVVAPLSANTLAKLAAGLADNLLTCVLRAWDWVGKPVLLAPAMNTYMWDNPFTETHLGVASRLGARIVPPVTKTLACGDVGIGGMAEPAAIDAAARAALAERPEFSHLRPS